MKQPIEALMRIARVVALAALVLGAATPAVRAAAPVVQLEGHAWLTRLAAPGGSVASSAKFHVTATFSTDTPGAQPFTIQRAVIFFPDHAGTNGRLFPSCSAEQIERFRGDLRRCPEGSKLGGGTVRAKALQLGVTARGRVTIFNSHRGKSITFNIRTIQPAAINASIDAPLTQLHGRYGEKLTLVVPHSLQEIIAGVFVGVEEFDVTIGGSVVAGGVRYSYLKARTCPKRALHGVFDFADWTTGQNATVTTDAKVHCTVG